ncbi:MAG: hypothetical protein AAF570_16725, partial [Bacteroidota bacterium]
VESLGPVKDTFGLADATAYLATVNGTFQNLAVPGATLSDLSDPNFGLGVNSGGSPYYHRFASNPGTSTVIGDAAAQDPTFFVYWPGMQDIYDWASVGGAHQGLLIGNLFESRLDSVLSVLTQNGAKGALATIPDIDHMPFYHLVPSRSAELSQARADSLNDLYALAGLDIGFEEGENGFIVDDDGDFRQLTADEYILITSPLDSMRCFLLGILFSTMPDRYTLIESELSFLRATIATYNNHIRAAGVKYDLAVVEMDPVYASVNSGITIDAADLSAEFGAGGFYSLDGATPTPKGAGHLANAFIEAINTKYSATISPVRLDALRGVLFP